MMLSSIFFTGCYTLTQGIEQAKLISRRVPVDDVLKEGRESPERLKKLKLVPEVLSFAQERIGLTPGSSYKTYVPLDRPALTYVVQAAEKRSLKLKTWWFPIVGRQPYLGFFDRKKADAFQKEMVAEGFDTSMGGVQAFSLLGYFPDPIYSTMIDGNDELAFVELLFHETLHRTLYVPDAYTFNENLAEFVSRRATLMFLRERANLFAAVSAGNTEKLSTEQIAKAFEQKHERMQTARQAFGAFLNSAKVELNEFYARSDVQQLELPAFTKLREEKFAALHARFQKEYGEKVGGTYYASFFQPGRFNNATFLGASVYEARQEPFAQLLEKSGSDLAKFLQAAKQCVSRVDGSEQDLWAAVENCGG
jgi:predicted aminopeptidase